MVAPAASSAAVEKVKKEHVNVKKAVDKEAHVNKVSHHKEKAEAKVVKQKITGHTKHKTKAHAKKV